VAECVAHGGAVRGLSKLRVAFIPPAGQEGIIENSERGCGVKCSRYQINLNCESMFLFSIDWDQLPI
jgi:hypothetical protein